MGIIYYLRGQLYGWAPKALWILDSVARSPILSALQVYYLVGGFWIHAQNMEFMFVPAQFPYFWICKWSLVFELEGWPLYEWGMGDMALPVSNKLERKYWTGAGRTCNNKNLYFHILILFSVINFLSLEGIDCKGKECDLLRPNVSSLRLDSITRIWWPQIITISRLNFDWRDKEQR